MSAADVIALYVPQLLDLPGLLVTWGVGLVLTWAGTALVGRGIGIEQRLIAGWGGLCLLLTVWGVLLPFPLHWPALGFAMAALALQALPGCRLSREDWRSLGRMFVLSVPLWLVMAPIRPSQADTFAYLLPNAMYLVDYGRFPTAWLPLSLSFLPAAPYNAQLPAFLGALALPGYPAAGLSLFNVLLFLAAGLLLARALARGPQANTAPSWSLTALGFLLATLLNPGFVPRIDFAGYAEAALAVTAMAAACLFAENQAALVRGERLPPSWALCLVLAAMVNSKQSGIGLVLALAGAAFLSGCAERRGAAATLARGVGLAVLPALVLYALWRYFAARAAVAELTPLPWSEWNWHIMPETLRSIVFEIGEKPTFFACIAAALVFLPVLLRRDGWTVTTRLLAIHAAVFVLYDLYLLAAYLAHFPADNARDAHSYFRYSTHLSLLMVLALALALRDLWGEAVMRRWPAAAGGAVIALALVVPVGFAYRLRFDLVMPQPLVWDIGAWAKPYLQDGDRLALLLPGDNGSVVDMLKGVLRDVPPRRRVELLYRPAADQAAFAEAARLGYSLALVSCTPQKRAALLRLGPEGWREVANWPYPADMLRWRWQRLLAWPPLCRSS